MPPRKKRRPQTKHKPLASKKKSRPRESAGPAFEKLVAVMARLRAPGGCPWDREQTHATLRTYLIEEAYEVLDALDGADDVKFAEELGDLLLQVTFHSQIASETNRFNIADVVQSIHDKMIRRHPHVFGDTQAKNSEEVLQNWAKIKAQERGEKEGEAKKTSALDGVLRSGRAVIYPVYKSTYERGDGMESDVANPSSTWRDHVIMWVKDASRAIDYVQSRPDLDHDKIAYYGYSWGAVMGGLVPAVEPRIKVNVLALGGLHFQQPLPEVHLVNFLPRVKQPTLMLNGRYDFFFPVDSSQESFYRLLGSTKDQKKHLIYDTGHSIPRNELIKVQ